MAQTRKDYLVYLEQIRWEGKPKCPYCKSINSTAIEKETRYHCNTCFNSYSVTVGTLFHKTYVDLQKWFLAISLIFNSRDSFSARQLAKKIGVNKNTAYSMIARIRKAMAEEPELLHKIAQEQELSGEPSNPPTALILAEQNGLQQGLQEGARRQLLRLLTLRFGTVPEHVETRLQSLNLNQLEELLEVALTADAIAQFANHLP
jgi:transposase-like protein